MKINIVFLIFTALLSSTYAYTGRLWMTTDAICTEQIDAFYKTDISDTARLKFIRGPKADTTGIQANSESILAKAMLQSQIGPEGTVAFWVHFDKSYQTGVNTKSQNKSIFEIENLCSLTFEQSASTLDFIWRWNKSQGNTQYHDLHILAPELPGDQWVQLVFRWSSSKGIFNCYINGTPYRQDETINGLNNPFGNNMVVYVSDIGFSEMIISDQMIEGRLLEKLLAVEKTELLDRIFGNERINKLDAEFIQGKLLYSNPLRSPKDIRGWLPEGQAKVSFDQNGLVLESYKPDGSLSEGNVVLWCGDDLPANFIAKWKFQPLDQYGHAMVLFCAKGKNGKNIYDPSIDARDGTFSQYVYGDINSYHITYYANTPYSARNKSSLWKNAGFYLADYGPSVVEPGSTEIYEATLVKIGGKIAMAINNWVIVDFFDDGQRFGDVLNWGKIGFRQMKWTKMRYSDFEIYDIKLPKKQEDKETDD
ncbi:MAG: DUF1961 family protein [Sedimentisphaeraceae bacterium JB056]